MLPDEEQETVDTWCTDSQAFTLNMTGEETEIFAGLDGVMAVDEEEVEEEDHD